MRSAHQATLVIVIVGLAVMAIPAHAQPDAQSEREAMYYRYLEFASYVKGGSIEPHWMADGSSFWYAEGAPDKTVIWKVDPNANTKTPLFDTARLRQALTALLGDEPPNKGLPFEEFTFVDESKTAVSFTVKDKVLVLKFDTYAIAPAPPVSEEEQRRLVPQITRKGAGYPDLDLMEIRSPDGRWFAFLKDRNVWLRSTADGGRVQLTTDGAEDYEWDVAGAKWSPDSYKLAAKKVDYRPVPRIPIVRYLKRTEEVDWVHYSKAGQPKPQTELFLVDISSKGHVRIDTGEEPDQHIYVVGWRPDGSELIFLRLDRYTKKLELMAANPATGSTRVVLTEARKTWIPVHRQWDRFFTFLEDGTRFIWLSERDGWKQLYLYSIDGTVIRQLTEGTFPVVQVVAVDEDAGWVYFTAQGDTQRPYDIHLYRVSLKGKRFARLTEARGQHDTVFTPSKAYFLDTHSTVDRPPRVDLRRADGTLLQTVSEANIDALQELGWTPPEEFKVKAGDGETDLWGVLYKPFDFDPTKKYPVLEEIYGGAWRSPVDRTFIPDLSAQAMAQIGFLVFMADGRGTPGRGRAFQAVGRGRVAQVIPEHVAILQHLAAERPYMDLSRVGIYGHSKGGYFTIRAMLQSPEIYGVGVASAPGVDSANSFLAEYWLGLPQENPASYEEASNTRLAANLQGKLLLVHGTSDATVKFAGTMTMVEAFIQAGKRFDLIVLPEQGHGFRGASGAYFREARYRYFQEHLQP